MKTKRRLFSIEFINSKLGTMETKTFEVEVPYKSRLIGVNVYAGKKGEEVFKQKVVTNNPYVA